MEDAPPNEEAASPPAESEKVDGESAQGEACKTETSAVAKEEEQEAGEEEKTDESSKTKEKSNEEDALPAADDAPPEEPVDDEASPADKDEKKEEEAPPKDAETETEASAESAPEKVVTPIVAATKKARPPYKYDPNKITLRFLFANRDGLTVTVECNPSDTVGEVKGALISVWPEDVPSCEGGESLRLVCMGKGYLMPDTRTLEDCQIPVFKTHPTPVNVSVKPNIDTAHDVKSKKSHDRDGGSSGNRNSANQSSDTAQASQGCPCTIL